MVNLPGGEQIFGVLYWRIRVHLFLEAQRQTSKYPLRQATAGASAQCMPIINSFDQFFDSIYYAVLGSGQTQTNITREVVSYYQLQREQFYINFGLIVHHHRIKLYLRTQLTNRELKHHIRVHNVRQVKPHNTNSNLREIARYREKGKIVTVYICKEDEKTCPPQK